MMTMIRRILLLLLPWLSLSTFAQYKDFGIWSAISAKHPVYKGIEGELTASIRTFNNSSEVEQYFIEAGISKKFGKHFEVAGSYRLLRMIEDNFDYYFRHKVFLDLKASVPVSKIDFSLRARMQRATKTYIEDEEDLDARYIARFKFEAAYRTKSSPFSPFVYFETFSPAFSGDGFNLKKTRLSAGTNIKLTRIISFELSYISQRDIAHSSFENIISLNCNLKFK